MLTGLNLTSQQRVLEGNLRPMVRELPADLDTPVSAYLKLTGHPELSKGPSFLLESIEGGEQIARYSFIGVQPRATFVARLGQFTRINGAGQTETLPALDPLKPLQNELAKYSVQRIPGLPRFLGGMVGYLGYEAARAFEPKLLAQPELPADPALPDAIFLLTDTLVAFDHARGRMLLIALAHLDDPNGPADAERRLDRLQAALGAALPHRAPRAGSEPGEVRSNVTREAYAKAVLRAKEHIAAGDVFQVVLSQRLSRRTTAESFDVYRALRRLNPSPYMFFFDFGRVNGKPLRLIGASPELLARLEGNRATVRPIAGTRRRGATHEEDAGLEQELLADPKERAEHAMLVDLGRNDVGRVSEYGSVGVPEMMVVERYSHVMHIVSQVEGTLKPGLTAFDLLRATFPAGTVSGAPKIRAMEIIHDLEGLRRGPYSGAVGYFSFDGAMDTCIALRTIVHHGDTSHVQAGAGLVADSNPALEYEETLIKARALLTAIDEAEKAGAIRETRGAMPGT